jgi:group I intron endonuclease
MNTHIIYKITNTINGKIYIGQTKHSVEKRLKGHIEAAKYGNGGCRKLCNAMRKYGYENFIIEKIDEGNKNNINDKEIYNIKLYDSKNNKIGYNIAPGGQGNFEVNDEFRKNVSVVKRKNNETLKLPPHISYVYSKSDKNKIIGYQFSMLINGKKIHESFQSLTTPLDDLLKDAIEYKNNILNGTKIEKKKYAHCNKEDGLPANISYIRSRTEDKKIVGYQLCITHNNKKIRKTFQNANGDLQKLLEETIIYKNNILKDTK